MASTYEQIATYTISGTSSYTYTFTSIPQTYTDLKLVISMRNTSGYNATDTDGFIRINGDTSSSYSYVSMGANGSSAYSSQNTDFTCWMWAFDPSATNAWANYEFDIFNYTSTNVKKGFIAKSTGYGVASNRDTGTWASTSAVTSLDITCSDRWRFVGATPDYFDDGTTFTLFGIKAA